MNVLLRMLLDLLLRFVRSLDLPLLGALLALMGVGLATLYSASNESMRVVLTQGVYFSNGLLRQVHPASAMHHDVVAGLCQAQRDRPAYASAGSGHQHGGGGAGRR